MGLVNKHVLSLIVSMALLSALVPGEVPLITTIEAQRAVLLAPEQVPAGNTEMLAAPSIGIWRNYTNGNQVYALAVEGK